MTLIKHSTYLRNSVNQLSSHDIIIRRKNALHNLRRHLLLHRHRIVQDLLRIFVLLICRNKLSQRVLIAFLITAGNRPVHPVLCDALLIRTERQDTLVHCQLKHELSSSGVFLEDTGFCAVETEGVRLRGRVRDGTVVGIGAMCEGVDERVQNAVLDLDIAALPFVELVSLLSISEWIMEIIVLLLLLLSQYVQPALHNR